MSDFTHFNNQGKAFMVNVSDKEVTQRSATASTCIHVSSQTMEKIKTGGMKKGDVLTVAQIAGIMGTKQTSSLIPMCHNIPLTGSDINITTDEDALVIKIR